MLHNNVMSGWLILGTRNPYILAQAAEFLFFKKDFSYLFVERGEGKEKERERNINVWLPLMHSLLGTWRTTQVCALTGNQTSNPLVRRPACNPLVNTRQVMIFYLKFLIYFIS